MRHRLTHDRLKLLVPNFELRIKMITSFPFFETRPFVSFESTRYVVFVVLEVDDLLEAECNDIRRINAIKNVEKELIVDRVTTKVDRRGGINVP